MRCQFDVIIMTRSREKGVGVGEGWDGTTNWVRNG